MKMLLVARYWFLGALLLLVAAMAWRSLSGNKRK